MNEKDYEFLKMKVKKLAGLSLDAYKGEQMMRRLDGYIARHGYAGVVPFFSAVEKDKEILQQLMDFLTINVSEFFRDNEQFNVLKTRVIPDLLKKSQSLNIWSAGCSIGAEPYSVAMLLDELSPHGKHRILATDLDDKSLARARSGGPYAESHLEQVTKGVMLKNFVKSDEGYTVAPKFLSKVDFKRHNLLNDPFEVGFDLIMCRNVTIYFTEETKETLNKGFAKSLNNDGVLFIGSTESMLDAQSMGLKRMFASFFCKEDSAKANQSSALGMKAKAPAARV
ncbi:MAG: protein-glutamate O-methyltransferase CheR [SAR202 cluster bacterium]|nr:protein-glutamate O-methyltransferase CheR [SAR202 cluster bacterium]